MRVPEKIVFLTCLVPHLLASIHCLSPTHYPPCRIWSLVHKLITKSELLRCNSFAQYWNLLIYIADDILIRCSPFNVMNICKSLKSDHLIDTQPLTRWYPFSETPPTWSPNFQIKIYESRCQIHLGKFCLLYFETHLKWS